MSSPAVAKPFAIPTAKPVVSLMDIMDEELAFKMHEKENNEVFEEPKAEYDDELDEDLKLALQISAAEVQSKDEVEDKTAAQPSAPEDTLDKDFMLALQLQNELNDEQYARHLAEKARLSQNQSKVSTSWDIHYQEEYKGIGTNYYSQEYDGLDEESEGSSEEELEQELEPEEQPSEGKMHHVVSKQGGRVPAREIITKHDPLLAGVKNAHAAERMLDSGNLKNIKLSTPVFNALVHHTRKQQVGKL